MKTCAGMIKQRSNSDQNSAVHGWYGGRSFLLEANEVLPPHMELTLFRCGAGFCCENPCRYPW